MRAGRDRRVAGQKRLPDHLSGTPAPPGLGRRVPRLKPRRGRRTHAGNHGAQRVRPYGVAVVGGPQRDGPQRDEVWLVTLDPTQGVEIQKTRPCLVSSPDEMNRHLRTVIIAPIPPSSPPPQE